MELDLHHGIGQGKIIHKRTRDTQNFFEYNAPYVCLNLNQTQKRNLIKQLENYRKTQKIEFETFNKSKQNSRLFPFECSPVKKSI